ncbi:hypothetical protein PV396_17105 [Streptomyces sp. ME02-8801-2C]|uniref:hypothetical protein n=1 Tax=Streptomyces sp. ME02-8801-2C TaxID=3028680 RepID=UPI0029BD45E7|nr:hypothetical protein [Streptomyces sp. ME02-8801-2C]MDX3453650.1 hypothetical protein [Streptomyces sp. ME02-8801-2C]
MASSIIVTVGGLATGAATAEAAPQSNSQSSGLRACGSSSYDKDSGYNYYPTGFPSGGWLRTSYGCGRISVMTNSNRNVKVCRSYGGNVTCQGSYTYATSGKWTELESGVPGGTYYKLRFQSTGRATGWIND